MFFSREILQNLLFIYLKNTSDLFDIEENLTNFLFETNAMSTTFAS